MGSLLGLHHRHDPSLDRRRQRRPKLNDCGQSGVRAQVRRKRALAVMGRIVVSLCRVVGFVAWWRIRAPVFETSAFNRSATCPGQCRIVPERTGYVSCWIYEPAAIEYKIGLSSKSCFFSNSINQRLSFSPPP